MKSLKIIYLVLIVLTLSCSKKQYDIIPGEIWKDNNGTHINAHGGGILFHQGVYYWYGEHKIEGKAGNKAMVGVHCYSSKNLTDWKDEGISLKVIKNDSTHDITEGCVLERPKVIYNSKTKKFVMWFHLELKNQDYKAARSGVAISDNPQGPFTYVKSFRPNAGYWPQNVLDLHKKPISPNVKKEYCGGIGCLPAHPDTLNILGRDFKLGQMARDQNLFVDDDGKAYQIYSSEENSTLHISQLSDDFLSESGNYIRVFPNRYMEAATIFKRNNTYYIIASDCTGWKPNAARSAWAPTIFGPWEELGNPAIGDESELTFRSQSTFVLPIQGKKDAFMYMGDRWNPENAIDGRYIWLPLKFDNNKPVFNWFNKWSLSF
jgi:hypothetical protein